MHRGMMPKVAAAAALFFAFCARAEEYPSRPVTIVVSSAAGGTQDFSGRIVGEALSKALGQQFIVENKSGASGNIGIQAVARAAPDGYTLLMSYSGYQVTNPNLFPKLGWDPLKDFQSIALVVKAPHVVLVRKDLPASSLAELAELARTKPGGLTYASSGIGSIQQIGAELFGLLTGGKMVHVPYRGAGPAMTDLVAGNVDMFITTPPSAVGHLASGAVKGIALAAAERHPMLPQVPTAAEAGLPGLELVAWFALHAPANTPRPIVDRLSTAVRSIVKAEDFKRRVEANGAYAVYLGPEELTALQEKELPYWREVIRKTNIKVE